MVEQPVPEPWTAPAGSEAQDSTSSRGPEGSYISALAGWALCHVVSLKVLGESLLSCGDLHPVLLSLPVFQESSEMQIYMKFPDFFFLNAGTNS